ncbi:MAG: Hsp20/alpha crystallin family protein [Thermoproteota archaeon]|nr:Hsp20/alpha crystallin family protein [Thermoproteota archaeon]
MGNNDDVLPFDSLFNRFFNIDARQRERGGPNTRDIFDEFDDLHREIARLFNVSDDIPTHKPVSIKREHDRNGYKLRPIGPIVYGYSITIESDGKPRIHEFGNVKPSTIANNTEKHLENPSVRSKEIPFDVTATDKEVKVVLDIPGIREEDIKINTRYSELEIKTSGNAPREYYKAISLPNAVDTETMRFRYNNGILEVTFDKKKDVKSKIKVGFVNLLSGLSGLRNRF